MKITHKPLTEMTMDEMFASVSDPTSPHYIQPTPDIPDDEYFEYYDETQDLMAVMSEAQLVKMYEYARTLLS